MKKGLIFLILASILAGCNNEKIVKPNTPISTTHLMKLQIENKNYSAFQSLFSKGNEEAVSKEMFQQLGKITTAGTNYKNFELLSFENGKMLLVEFEPKLDNKGDYKIVSVKVVPEEMKDLFETK